MALTWRLYAKVLLVFLLPSTCASAKCANDHSCEAHVTSLLDDLGAVSADMQGKRDSLQIVERLVQSVTSGSRLELPLVQRQHLESGSPLVGDVLYDLKHRPVSTNRTRHVHRSKFVANASEVILQALMPIKPKMMSSKAGPFTLVITVDADGSVSMHSATTGDLLVDSMPLGHRVGARIRHLVLSRDEGTHYLLTADELGELRVHDVKVVAKKAQISKWESAPAPPSNETQPEAQTSKESASVPGHEQPDASEMQELATRISDRKITISVSFRNSLQVALDAGGRAAKLNAVMSVERDDGIYLVAGDSHGVLTVFAPDGKLAGRTKVTDDAGGIRGLLRGHMQQLVFFSSHSFGFFSVALMEVPFPPCTGWTAPLVDLVLDPTYAYSRAFLALADGDVLVFSTKKEKVRVCELMQKFPHVSKLPFKLQMWKYHVVGMQLPPPVPSKLQGKSGTHQPVDHFRELFFFNTLAMDAVHGEVQSRIITAQLNFRPKRIDDFTIIPISGMAPGERSRAQLALRYTGEHGVEISELTLKQPSPPKDEDTSSGDGSSLMSRFPKMAVFAVAVLAVVLWNLRKARWRNKSQVKADPAFDDEPIKEGTNEASGVQEEEQGEDRPIAE